MDSHIGYIMTVSNSIIGVSILAMPFCFKQCGIILAIVMLLASSVISRLTCHYLLKSATMARRRTFELLAFHAFGTMGKLMVELGIIGFLMGTCIAFFVIIGDLGPAIFAKVLEVKQTDSLRTTLLICVAVFCILPLGLLKNVSSLGSVSTATIGFYFCLVLKTIGESASHFASGDWVSKVDLWNPHGILQCLPIFAMALSCQTQLFEIYETLPNASLEKMNYVVRSAVNICVCVYICVGFFGYIAFATHPFTGNILMSFSPSMMTDIMKIGFVLSVACSFPLVIFPCRASLYSLLFKKGYTPYEGINNFIPETRFKLLTLFIVMVSLVIGIMIPNIEVVLGLLGSTIGTMICVIFPVTCFICISTKNTNERLLAQIMLFVGVIMMVLGTYANLYAMEEINTVPVHIERKFPIKTSMDSDEIINNLRNKYDTAMEKVKEKDEEEKKIIEMVTAAQDKEIVEIRQEPPQPVAPQDDVKLESDNKVEKVIVQPIKEEIPETKETPKPEEFDKAAIEKEDKELLEEEKDKSKVEDKNHAELLASLKQQKEVQQNLLKEQQKLLEEIKKETKELKDKKFQNYEKDKELKIKTANQLVAMAKQVIESLDPNKEENEINNEIKNVENPEKTKENIQQNNQIDINDQVKKLENAKNAIENLIPKEVKKDIPKDNIPIPLPIIMSNISKNNTVKTDLNNLKTNEIKSEPKIEAPKLKEPVVYNLKKEPKIDQLNDLKQDQSIIKDPNIKVPNGQEPKELKSIEPQVLAPKLELPKLQELKVDIPNVQPEERNVEVPLANLKIETTKVEVKFQPKKEAPEIVEPKVEAPKIDYKEAPKLSLNQDSIVEHKLEPKEPAKVEISKDEPNIVKLNDLPDIKSIPAINKEKVDNVFGRDILAANTEESKRDSLVREKRDIDEKDNNLSTDNNKNCDINKVENNDKDLKTNVLIDLINSKSDVFNFEKRNILDMKLSQHMKTNLLNLSKRRK